MTAMDGAAFVFSATEHVPAVWGARDRILWSEGEPVLLVGPDGVGKTTLAQQLVLLRCGLLDGSLLNLPVVTEERHVLYIAADRPRQAARSMRRMVSEGDRAKLVERLTVWKGPLPFDIGREPEALVAFAAEYGAGTVVLDSLKDVALDLATDEAGSRVGRAIQHVSAAGIQLLVLHHQRKGDGGPPKSIADVYGSRWLTSVCGSVLMLWGDAGSKVVSLRHLKQPDVVVGPLTVVHDHVRGRSALSDVEQPASSEPSLYERVVAWVNEHVTTPVPTKVVAASVEGRDSDIADALKLAAAQGDLHAEKGKNRAHLWSPAHKLCPTPGQTPADPSQVALPEGSARSPFRGARQTSEGTSAQTPADPDQNDSNLPPGYDDLTADEQALVDALTAEFPDGSKWLG